MGSASILASPVAKDSAAMELLVLGDWGYENKQDKPR